MTTAHRLLHCLRPFFRKGLFRIVLLALLLGAPAVPHAAERFVSFDSAVEGVPIISNGVPCVVLVADGEDSAVRRAVDNLRKDLAAVAGNATNNVENNSANAPRIVVGTLGEESLEGYFAQGLLDRAALEGKREKYLLTTVENSVIIVGSDRRGTVYGVYEFSRQLGVSPWYYWADVPIVTQREAVVSPGTYSDGEPAVRYRGIFLNDEAPCLTTWVKNTFGTDYGDHRFYERVFELLLRLKGNFLWPAMWGWAFYADDPANGALADEMGIIIGTSHHEPMARNHQEWARHRADYGAWNYTTNQAVIDQFFREGIERVAGREDLITIGMRGDGDEPMSDEANVQLLQTIINNQREIISTVTGKPADATPQVWALYKEVLDYYNAGMAVPDDVILLLCDDNWGNIRQLPNASDILARHTTPNAADLSSKAQNNRLGLYYHVDYVGAPRNSKWLNMTPIQNMWEQLTLATQYDVDALWVLNVGDLKPMEYPIQFFLDMAWGAKDQFLTPSTLTAHVENYCASSLGTATAAPLLNKYCKYAGRCTAEMLDADTYNLATGEWQQVVGEWCELERDALRLFCELPEIYCDAYKQLILFPIQAMANLHELYYSVAMNRAYYSAGNDECNRWADRAEQAFRRDRILCDDYNNSIADGKWRGMMTQKHIGYTTWADDFPQDTLPQLFRLPATRGENSANALADSSDNTLGGYSFTPSDGYISIEAEHVYEAIGEQWTVIPDQGRTLSGIALMPYNIPPDGAQLNYRVALPATLDSICVHVVLKSTLAFARTEGHRYAISITPCAADTFASAVVVNYNGELNEAPENIYTTFYPTVAARVIDSSVTLPLSTAKPSKKSGRTSKASAPSDLRSYTLSLQPLDPGMVVQKIVLDWGGYQPTRLFMPESPRTRE